MAATLHEAGTSNAFTTTLNGSVSAGANTITLTSVTGLVAPGILVIDRQDGSGNDTPSAREFISYTGISGNDLTGVVKGVGGSTDLGHTSGALVEETFSITHWNDMIDYLQVEHDSVGKHVISTATITTHLNASGASVVISDLTVNRYLAASGASVILGSLANLTLSNSLRVSGASVTGVVTGLNPVFAMKGAISGATTTIGGKLPIPYNSTVQFISVAVNGLVSMASIIFDINFNDTSLFTDQNTRLTIPAGGTYASTASIGNKSLIAGGLLSIDQDASLTFAIDPNIVISAR